MLRAEYFTLLSVSQVIKFVRRKKHFKQIRQGIMTLLQIEEDEMIKTGKLKKINNILRNSIILMKLMGWEEILADRTLRSELQEIKRINYIKRLDKVLDSKKIITRDNAGSLSDIYLYATYLKPGFHQLVIYCPLSKRAFCKEVVIDQNGQEANYPELPKQVGAKNSTRKIPNVW